MLTIYGIKNCDTLRKTLQWFSAQNIPFHYHDYRLDGIDKTWLLATEAQLGWQQMLNKRGLTWRQLPADLKDNLDQQQAIEIMLAQPTIIKRPIVIKDDCYHIGYNEAIFSKDFS